MFGTRHGFHLVNESPWPLLVSSTLLNITVSGAASFHYFMGGLSLLIMGLFFFILFFSSWIKDVIREATFLEDHKKLVQKGLRLGFLLFVLSKLCCSLRFFGHFFIPASTSHSLGSIWPPMG